VSAQVREVAPGSSSLAGSRFLTWLANPWGKARFLWVIAIAYVIWTLLPVAIAVLFSFNATRALTAWQGFSTRWYVGDVSSVWNDPELHSALLQSLKLSGLVVLIAVPLGVAFALALDRWRGRGSGTANFVMLFSFITPEIAIGVALLLFFTRVFTTVGLGFTAQVLGVSMYMMAYPVIIVRARLLSIGADYEEAAMDLGASPTQAHRDRVRGDDRQLRDLPAAVGQRGEPDDPDLDLQRRAARRAPIGERARDADADRVDDPDRARGPDLSAFHPR
jgi:ABC-type Fe3+ transport system permease subunit